MVVHDYSNPSIIHLNIPAKPNSIDMELSDTELDTVAGGIGSPQVQLNPPSLWEFLFG